MDFQPQLKSLSLSVTPVRLAVLEVLTSLKGFITDKNRDCFFGVYALFVKPTMKLK